MRIWYNLPMKKCYLSLFALAAAAMAGAATYKNPVLTMDFSDPDVCVGHDGKFYMTASSFGGLPGLPILVSDDSRFPPPHSESPMAKPPHTCAFPPVPLRKSATR